MSITFRSLAFEWPNGHSVFTELYLSLELGRKYGLIGPNGVGKSTLARLVDGGLAPSGGTILRSGRISSFAQSEEPPGISVMEYLAELWVRLDPRDRDAVESLADGIPFEAPCSALSGGQWTRARLLHQIAGGAEFIVLDEPTNNLDREAREAVLRFTRLTARGLLVISHDRELLGEVDSILELSSQGLAVYGGNWAFYEEERERERARLAEALRHAEEGRDKARRERSERLSSQEKRMTRAARSAPNAGLPKILLGARKRRAQHTLGKLQKNTHQEVESKATAAQAAFANLKTEKSVYAHFPETSVPSGKLIFEARDFNFRFPGAERPLLRRDLSFVMKGPSRISLTGGNGSGKSTLLRLLTGFHPPDGAMQGSLKLGEVHYGMLDQQARLLDPDLSVFANVDVSSAKGIVEVRNLLAQFLFPGKKADQLVGSLSGGERLRASLAKILIADPAPGLLILDEPTNNLDLVNLEFLSAALSRFEGAMIVVSHDQKFLEDIGITEELGLG